MPTGRSGGNPWDNPVPWWDPWGGLGADFGPSGDDWPPPGPGLPPWMRNSVGRPNPSGPSDPNVPQHTQGGGKGGKGMGDGFGGGGGGGANNLGRLLKQFLSGALQQGFDPYQGQMVAGPSQTQDDLLNAFFGDKGGFQTSLEALSGMAQQDSLGRAQMLLDPARQRSIQQTSRGVRERLNLGNNLLSAGGANLETRAVGDVNAGFDRMLAEQMPEMEALRMQAAGAIPGLFGQAYSIAEAPRALAQQQLDANYNEFLRTDPSGGPLQAILGLMGTRHPNAPGQQRGPTGAQQALGFLSNLFGGGLGAAVLNRIFAPNQNNQNQQLIDFNNNYGQYLQYGA